LTNHSPEKIVILASIPKQLLMEWIEVLTEAIRLKKPISYEYEAPERAIGIRYGNPHAIFISTSGNVNIHIYKTGGVSSDTKPIPCWKEYKVVQIRNVVLLAIEPAFDIATGYNPISKLYLRMIAKI
jgi:hypothetical protein